MSSDSQRQDLRGDAYGVQSGRDTNISHGLSQQQMREIFQEMQGQNVHFVQIAREVVDMRMADLEERLIERFCKEDVRSEAFADPDFQYLLNRTAHSYARSGEEETRDLLVDLVAKRSACTERSRFALVLNEAVEKTSVLTREEFSVLSLSYFLRYTRESVTNLTEFGAYLDRFAAPLLPDISGEEHSFQYLAAQSCASIELGEVGFDRVMSEKYGGLFQRGYSRDEITAKLGVSDLGDLNGLIMPCFHDAGAYQIAALNESVIDAIVARDNLSQTFGQKIKNAYQENMLEGDEIEGRLGIHCACYSELRWKWSNTSLKHLSLTSVGLAIAHANLVQKAGFEPPLTIWVK